MKNGITEDGCYPLCRKRKAEKNNKAKKYADRRKFLYMTE